jgi:hypothetical protein
MVLVSWIRIRNVRIRIERRKYSVADPHRKNADADPGKNLDADPDADPDADSCYY